MSSAKRPPSCLGLNESMSQWVNEAKNELMKPRLYLLWIHFVRFFPMFAIHMCEKICFFPEILVRHYVLCVCTCTNQLVLSTEVTRLNFLNSIVMGKINQCGFQSHVAIDRYCIFLEINTFEFEFEFDIPHEWIQHYCIQYTATNIKKYSVIYKHLSSLPHNSKPRGLNRNLGSINQGKTESMWIINTLVVNSKIQYYMNFNNLSIFFSWKWVRYRWYFFMHQDYVPPPSLLLWLLMLS